MQIGALSTPVTRQAGDTRPLQVIYSEAIDRVCQLEQDGFEYFQAGEHHFTENQWNPCPLEILAAVAMRTSTLRLGTNVLLTPLYHPVRLAEEAATIDLLSNGRLNLVCGSGSSEFEFETYGINVHERVGRTWETMSVLRKAFTSEEVFDHKGKYYDIPHVRMTTKPVQNPFPMWFGGFGAQMLRRAGKEGYHLFSAMPANWDAYYEGLKEGGHDPKSVNMGLTFVTMYVVEKENDVEPAREMARERARAQMHEYHTERSYGYQNAIKDAPPLFDPNGAFGTPEQVLKQMEPLLKDGMYTHVSPTGIGNRALFLKEVMPVLKSWGRKPVTV